MGSNPASPTGYQGRFSDPDFLFFVAFPPFVLRIAFALISDKTAAKSCELLDVRLFSTKMTEEFLLLDSRRQYTLCQRRNLQSIRTGRL